MELYTICRVLQAPGRPPIPRVFPWRQFTVLGWRLQYTLQLRGFVVVEPGVRERHLIEVECVYPR